MKICAVTTWLPHRDGIALYSAQLYGYISEKIEVKVLANTVDPEKEASGKEEKGNCRVIRCWKRGSATYPFKIFSRVLAEKPNLVHLQHGWLLYGGGLAPILFPLLLLLLRLIGKPVVVTMHTVIGENPRVHENTVINFIARVAIIFLTKIIVKLSDGIVVHNNLMKEALRNLYSLHKDCRKISVIPHGVKENEGRPKGALGEVRGRGLKVLSLGFIRRLKGIEYLIEAFKIFSAVYPGSTLIIVGGRHPHDNGKYIESLKRLLNGTKNVVFTGFIDEETLDELIWDSEIIVLPSLGNYYIEASGSLARVAMYGKPIICSKVPKFKAELEDGKDCIMVEFNDSRKLADALLLLAGDENLRRSIGINLRSKFKDKVWSKVAERHIELFKAVTSLKYSS